jgi:molybdenum cofactor biosynthesis enzyme MoaA
MVDVIKVSVDAARKDTYEKLRRGGKWETLCSNLEYIASLRQSSEIGRFSLNFVVQRENFREMSAFVDCAKGWCADEVRFTKLQNWGTFSPESFVERNVFHPDNPHYGEAVCDLINIKKRTDIRIMELCLHESEYESY